jgi:1-acyl-sn-glycerol-3-phosphate acyltransferase
MNRYAQQIPPRWWGPKLSPFWVRFWRPLRKRSQYREQKLMKVEFRQLEHLKEAVACDQGVLITPNHSGHADAHIMCNVADELRKPFYFMTAWQVFLQRRSLGRLMLQHHGCFSVDREGTDLKAFRQATKVLREGHNPLVIFPEGEVYHTNERITPFREGAAAAVIAAARRSDKPVVCVPCGIHYKYLDDPTDQLVDLMNDLEQRLFWRPLTDLPLHERIYRFAEGAMALKELEYFGRTRAGALPDRTEDLARHVLASLEDQCGIKRNEKTIPERVKDLRRFAMEATQDMPTNAPEWRRYRELLDDVFLVVQLYSYPGDYVKERPTIERVAETLDKFEEDVLGVYSATVRGRRKATVSFGEPIAVESSRKNKGLISELNCALETGVQQQLDELVACSVGAS